MIQDFIEGLLGTSGVRIVDWYMAHDLLINGVIVGLALLYVVFPSSGRRINSFFKALYLKSGLAPDEKDRQAIDRTKAMYRSKISRRRRA